MNLWRNVAALLSLSMAKANYGSIKIFPVSLSFGSPRFVCTYKYRCRYVDGPLSISKLIKGLLPKEQIR
jgi:hypothetical protein